MTTDRDYDGPCKPDKHGKRGCPIWHCEEHRDRWPDYAVEAEDLPTQHEQGDPRRAGFHAKPEVTRSAGGIADYDATDDLSRSIDEAYAAIRARVAAGGKGWEPK